MTVFDTTLIFVDHRGKKATRRFKTQNIVGGDLGAELLIAQTRLQGLVTAFEDVSGANVLRSYITVNVTEDSGALPVQSAGVNECANVIMHLTTAGKLVNVSVPSPEDNLFVNGETEVNVTLPTLQALASELAGGFFVSDQEVIDTTQGTGGLKGGSWASKRRS